MKRKMEQCKDEDGDVEEDSEEELPPRHLSLFTSIEPPIPKPFINNITPLNPPPTQTPSPPPLINYNSAATLGGPVTLPGPIRSQRSSVDSILSSGSDEMEDVIREIRREKLGQLESVQEVVDSYHRWHVATTTKAFVKVHPLDEEDGDEDYYESDFWYVSSLQRCWHGMECSHPHYPGQDG